jgi:hypothetical protein
MFGGFAEEAAGVALDLNSQSGAMIAFGAAQARPAVMVVPARVPAAV